MAVSGRRKASCTQITDWMIWALGFLELRQAEQARGHICWAPSSSSFSKVVLWKELVREGGLG